MAINLALIIIAGVAIVALIGLGGFAASFLYRNRPKPDDQEYFWDEGG